MSKIIIEVCVFSLQSAIIAEQAGAKRIELCANYYEGGTTPSAATIELARKFLDINLNVIIRPRGGDFYYSDLEFKNMKRDIEIAKELGADGVVFGILNRDGSIDEERNFELIKLSESMSTTFHRAFDMTANPFFAMEKIISIGFDRILTSGQKQTALEGKDLIKTLIEKADDKIIIIPGSGINEDNIAQLKEITQAVEYHLTAKSTISSKMIYQNNFIKMGGIPQISEYETIETNIEKLQTIINILK